jgi:hypothetical protein
MLDERELAINPIVHESVQHNTRVSSPESPLLALLAFLSHLFWVLLDSPLDNL